MRRNNNKKKSTHPIAEARIAKQRAVAKAVKAENAPANVKASKRMATKAKKERRYRSRKPKKLRVPKVPKVDRIYPGMEVTGVVTR